MPIFLLSILLQVIFVVHIVKTNRSTTWIWIVIMLPMAGSIAYLFLEVLPDLTQTRTGRSATRKMQNAFNPDKDLKSASMQYAISDNVENTRRLADELFKKGAFKEAKELYTKCLRGFHANDPNLMFDLAKSEFSLENYQDTKDLLDQLIEINPDYKNQDAHLLYARSLERLGLFSKALDEYEVLHSYFSGPEASYYYGRFLKVHSQKEKADQVFEEILNKVKISNKHYKVLHAEIIRQVEREYKK